MALRQADEAISEVYGRLGVAGLKPRYSMTLMFLADGPMTIRQLSYDCGVTHSAMSQTIAAMRQAALVETVPLASDARARVVALTEAGAATVPLLRAEWAATEMSIERLEDELPFSLSELGDLLLVALERRSFADRVMDVIDIPENQQ
ncbi:MarR family winged helix-turn-helix transcriptional regulator [Nocardioides bruguierae]|uniref:MarR family transcriptional regulator n=1 Tax=Nocardioides bruguierae TaxID=2945102 RepID=A0A9X2IHR1_9ACTN|nr:helix-turn-helix domain-containing protein [Nocardioides bruguierae]MCM0622854.1 MarR family transcriptional regulator [Nocardioides bruguierae]